MFDSQCDPWSWMSGSPINSTCTKGLYRGASAFDYFTFNWTNTTSLFVSSLSQVTIKLGQK